MGFFSALFEFSEDASCYYKNQASLFKIASFHEVSESKHGSYFREHCEFLLSDETKVSAGVFSMPSLMELRENVHEVLNDPSTGIISRHDLTRRIRVRNMIGEARSLHTSDEVKNTSSEHQKRPPVVIQAASQFNMLEFPSPSAVPESGISTYIYDRTQGPACAVACAAGTAYRNYLVPVPFGPTTNDEIKSRRRGQTRERQLNGLSDVEEYLAQDAGLGKSPWRVKNGYVESSVSELKLLNRMLSDSDNKLSEGLISRVRIGIQENTTVTDDRSWNTRVTQTYNSAMSIGYSSLPGDLWQAVSQIILEATYEATLLVGVLHSHGAQLPPPIVFLTKIGGGVFQNKDTWIRCAMMNAIKKVEKYGVPLDVRIVHFGTIDKDYVELENIDTLQKDEL
mmetsp:Transcript_9052/g.11123  ORF Transcript_9052/g.11123 Transcript_9052/m.11123 type:complete len:396 (+) Transcript_9052:143-1330(+)|eukprot:CAMPEP_0172514692 /NCGR_PEP_ID=MMETSP1066-20121228/262073_1 /TAXON_ID=671091 /ORGANISM="Coscinodiscus wailesii, Strain CCMP2513" /LENGTH=395 /DNA_ID=CAMNT_0013295465 /DNA_START=143 /DNA_END=1330 /DNA_ORIENTATION=-